jgi:hypothetical protein
MKEPEERPLGTAPDASPEGVTAVGVLNGTTTRGWEGDCRKGPDQYGGIATQSVEEFW